MLYDETVRRAGITARTHPGQRQSSFRSRSGPSAKHASSRCSAGPRRRKASISTLAVQFAASNVHNLTFGQARGPAERHAVEIMAVQSGKIASRNPLAIAIPQV